MAETLTLRNFKADDLDDFMAWASDPEVTKYLTWEPYRSREDALNYITTVAMLDPWCKAICLNGQAIGSLHLRCGTGIHRCVAELGFCLAKKYWGQGIMSQAVRLALSTGFQDLGVFRIQALVEPKNTRSQRALEKAGFHREALLRNFVVHKRMVRIEFWIATSSLLSHHQDDLSALLADFLCYLTELSA